MNSGSPPSPVPPVPTSLHGGDAGEHTDVMALHSAVMREKAEPHEGMEPTSLWLIALALALVFWGGYYISQYSAGFDWTVYDARTPAAVKTAGAAKAAGPSPMVQGKAAFAVCAGCHGDNGEGNATTGIPPLAGSEWVQAKSPVRMIRIDLQGAVGPIQVKGKTYNFAGGMPAIGESLPAASRDADLAHAITYIRNSWGNKAPAVTPEEVKAVESAVKSHAGKQWTEAELKQVPLGPATVAQAGKMTPDQLKAALKALPADQLKEVLKTLPADQLKSAAGQ